MLSFEPLPRYRQPDLQRPLRVRVTLLLMLGRGALGKLKEQDHFLFSSLHGVLGFPMT
jgi:hypothetical protein